MKELIADILGLVRVFHFTKDETFDKDTINEKISTAISNLSNSVNSKLNLKSDVTHKHVKTDITDLKKASNADDGLMSSSDKTKLDGIEAGANKITVDSNLSSSSTNPVQNKVIKNGMYTKEEIHDLMAHIDVGYGKLLSINVTEDGILQVDNDSFEYYTTDEVDAELAKKTVTFEQQANPDSGYFATYVLKQNNVQVGPKINIPQDFLIRSGSVKTCTVANNPVQGYKVGDKYLDLVINAKEGSSTDNHLYILANDFVDDYYADNITLQLVNRVFSIKDKGVSKNKLSDDVQISLDYADTFNNSPCKDITTDNIIDWNNKAEISDIPTKVSELANDRGYLTAHQDISMKVDKVSGKGLSTEDFTSAEKTKLGGIEAGANKTTIDSSMSTSSTNPVQNKVVKDYIDDAVGDIISGDIDLSSTHNHDDRYFTESEINTKLNTLANSKSKVSITPTKTSGTEIATITIDGTPTKLYQQDNNTTYGDVVAGGASGLMTGADKTKLDGIATGANKTVLNNTVNSTSTTEAATANAVKTAYDKANHSHPYSSSSHNHTTHNTQSIASGTDLNTITTAGWYNNNSNSDVQKMSNTPWQATAPSSGGVGQAFAMEVLYTYGCIQILYPYNSNDIWVRRNNSNALGANNWTGWTKVFNNANLTKADITALGIPGTDTNTTYSADNSSLQVSSNQFSVKSGGITSSHIADGTIVNGDIADATIETGKLKDSAVTTAKIANGAVTNEKLSGTKITASSSSIVDLNDATYQKTGFYYCDNDNYAPYIIHCPWSNGTTTPYTGNKSFFLFVEDWGTNNYSCKQTLTYYNINSTFTRTKTNSTTWTAWKEHNTNNNDYLRLATRIVSGESAQIPAHNIIGGGTDSKYHIVKSGVVLNPKYPILFNTSAIAINSYTDNVYVSHTGVPLTNNVSGLTVTSQKQVYIEGTSYDGRQFKVSDKVFVSEDNLTNGNYYIYIGVSYSTTNIRFNTFHQTVYIKSKDGLVPVGDNTHNPHMLVKSDAGTAGYFKFLTIRTKGVYHDQTIEFDVTHRGNSPKTFVSFNFNTYEKTSGSKEYYTNIQAFYYHGSPIPVYYIQTNDGVQDATFDFYIRRETWDEMGVSDLRSSINNYNGMTVTWHNEFVTALPSGTTQATLNPYYAQVGHTHGSISTNGQLNSDITGVNKIAVTDSSNNLKTISQLPYSKISGTPTITNNLTTSTTGTALDASQGKWLKDNTVQTAGTGLTKSSNTLGITNGGVGATQLASNAVEEGKIKDGAVTTNKLGANAVTSAKIADGTIVNGDIADNTIESGKIKDGTIVNGDIANNTIEQSKMRIISANGGGNTAGYVKVMKIVLTGTYPDRPITFDMTQRHITAPQHFSIKLQTGNHTNYDAPLESFTYTGSNEWKSNHTGSAYIYKEGTATYSVIIQKSEADDGIYIRNLISDVTATITYPNELLTSLPTSNITQATFVGFTSAEKTKLNGIATGANNYTHPTSYGAKTGVPTANATLTHGGTFTVTQPVTDAMGHVTALNTRTYTLPTDNNTTYSKGNGLLLSGTTFSADFGTGTNQVARGDHTHTKSQITNFNSEVINLIYPVGSIYMSVNNTSPSTLFPGTTWTALEGRFLLGSGVIPGTDSVVHEVNEKGGKAEVSLITDELPKHVHDCPAGSAFVASDVTVSTGDTKRSANSNDSGNYYWQSTEKPNISRHSNTEITGEGQAHDNIPPYLVVNMWKRTA